MSDRVDCELRDDEPGADPFAFWQAWFTAALDLDREANAVALATVDATGAPSVRMVLCKAVDAEHGTFRWFTNAASHKGHDLAADPRAALAFHWPGLERQVRVTGSVEPVTQAAVAEYFATRSPVSRIGAHASRQSHPIATRAELERQADAVGDAPTEQPDGWNGYDLVADEIEFWQGRTGRLHDRITFVRTGSPAVDRFDPAELSGAATEVRDPFGRAWLRLRLQP